MLVNQIKEHQEMGVIDEVNSWVVESQKGNVRTFELLYREYFKKLFLFCRRMSGSISVAEELVQESFIKAWQALPEFRKESSFYTWLRTIASRLIIDRFRLSNEKIWQNTDEFNQKDYKCQLNPELQMDLEKMIALLPNGARSVLVLHELEGYPHNEIAIMLNIAEGTSKAQLFRAKKLLRDNYLVSQQINCNQTENKQKEKEA